MKIRLLPVLFCAALMIAAGTGGPKAAGNTPPASRVKLITNDMDVSPDGSAVTTSHFELYADNTAAAAKLGQISVAYNAATQTLDIVEAYTLKKDGSKIPVDVSAIYDQLAPGDAQVQMLTNMHVKTIVFPQFEAGDTAVYTFKNHLIHPLFPGQFAYGDAYPTSIAYDEVRETLTAPSSMAFQVSNHSVSFDKRQSGDKTVYSWHYSAPEPAQPENYAVSPIEHAPRFFISTYKDYAALGMAYAQAAAPKAAVTPPIQALADKITAGVAGKRAQAEKIYDWVSAHIRYVGIELGTGAYVPRDAQTVLSNGYGDCKDHVVMLEALLKAKGIDSEAVLINLGNEYALTDVPTFVDFNHVITYLPKYDAYLDSTAGVAPFGVLPFDEYGKPVVFATPTDAHRGMTPTLPPNLASLTQTTTTTLDASGHLTGTTMTTATGPFAISLRQIALGAQAIGPEAAAKVVMAGLGYGADVKGELSGPSPTGPTPSFTETGTFSVSGWEENLSNNKRFYMPGGMRLMGLSGDVMAGPLDGSLLKPDAEVVCFSGTASEDLSLSVPDNVRFAYTPDDVHVKTDHVRFDAHWSLSKNTMHVHRVFVSTFTQPICTADMRASLAPALKTINDSYSVELLLMPAAEAASRASGTPTEPATPSYYLFPMPSDPKFAALYQQAARAITEGNDDKVMDLLNNTLQQPDLPVDVASTLHGMRGMLRVREGDGKNAIDELTAAMNGQPDNSLLLLWRGRAYFSNADISHALADADAVLAKHPDDAFALFQRANCEMEIGDYQPAARDYNATLAAWPKNSEIFFLRGVAYEKLGQYSKARADIDEAAKLGDEKAESDFASITAPRPAEAGGPHAAAEPSAPPPISGSTSNSVQITSLNQHTGGDYPPLARRLYEEGITQLSFTIQTDGSVGDPAIAKSSGFPMLDQAAVEATKKWRYKPILIDGKPVTKKRSVEVLWKLRSKPMSGPGNNGGS